MTQHKLLALYACLFSSTMAVGARFRDRCRLILNNHKKRTADDSLCVTPVAYPGGFADGELGRILLGLGIREAV